MRISLTGRNAVSAGGRSCAVDHNPLGISHFASRGSRRRNMRKMCPGMLQTSNLTCPLHLAGSHYPAPGLAIGTAHGSHDLMTCIQFTCKSQSSLSLGEVRKKKQTAASC